MMTKEQIMQTAMDHVYDMVIAYDLTGDIVFANRTAKDLLDYQEEIYNHTIVEIFPGIFRFSGGMVQLMCSNEGDSTEVDAYRANRTCFPVQMRLTTNQDGTCVCVAFDRTKETYLTRKNEQVGQEAQVAEKIKSEFVANVTHELRTPVNGILGNILELKEMESDPAKMRILSLVERGCGDMNAIINNILDFSKLESGKFTLEKREFEFRTMMEYIKSNHKRKITEKGLEFTMSIAPDIPEKIIGDELRIVQVLNNLLSNACKFTSVGSIAVEVVKTAQMGHRIELFFLVMDTGIGINKVDQDKLFKSFSQVDASISRRYGGTGLGLNICKQLVEMMDGDIHVESDEGQGSMFSFQIWVDVPADEVEQSAVGQGEASVQRSAVPIKTLSDFTSASGMDEVRSYGSKENLEEINRNLNKLILSVEMDNWEKAEGFSNTLRELTALAPQEIKNAFLRLKMAVQRQDYDRVTEQYEQFKQMIEQ